MVGPVVSEEFHVDIGLNQRIALSPSPFFHCGGINQQEDQHEGCSQEDDVRR